MVRRPVPPIFLLPLWCTLLLACSGPESRPESGSEPLVTFHPTFVSLLTETPATPHLAFGEVGGMVLQDDGSLAILDRMAAEVRVVDMEGRLLRTLGRPGQGPGELSGELTLALLPTAEGGLALPDLDRGTLVTFDNQGEPGATIPWDVAAHFLPDWRPGETPGAAFARAVTDSMDHLVRLDLLAAGGLGFDTLASVPRIRQPPNETEPRWPLLMDRWVWDIQGDRAVAARTSAPEVLRFQGGSPVRRVVWEGEPAPAAPPDVENLLEVVARTQGSPGEVPEALRARMLPPERLHAVADLRLGPGGLILVQRPRPTSEMDRRVMSALSVRGLGGPRWDVFSWEGEPLGVLEFPSNVELFQILGDTLVGVLEGEAGVQQPFVATLPGELSQSPTEP